MTLRPAVRRTAVGLLLMSAGCAAVSPGRDSLLSRMTALRTADDEDGPPRQAEPELDAEDADESNRIGSASETEPQSPPIRETSLTAGPPARKFDAATTMLIETELKDCPPAERDHWLDYLQSIPAETVPHALRARRMQAARTAAAPAAGLAQHSATANPGALPRGEGHSALSATANAPRLQFEAFDSAGDMPPTDLAANGARLSTGDLSATVDTAGGVSPFGRRGTRETSIPASPTGFGGFLTRTDATAEVPPAERSPTMLPAINPNQPGEVPIPTTGASASEVGYLEPGRSFESLPNAGSVAGDPGAAPLNSTTLQSAYWQDALQRLTALVEAEVSASQPGLSDAERVDYIKRQVWLRMLYLMAEQPQRAQSAIPGLNPSEQEFWTALFWAVSNYFDAQSTPDAAARAALTLEQLEYARSRLQQQAALELKRVSFCYKINSFGNFESWPRDEFRPGQTVLLYAEVSNFESRPQAEGRFDTRLKSYIEIRRGGADGELIEQNTLPATEDTCRSPRRDYFHSYTIDLPQYLSPGPYTLVLKVEDEFSGKSAVHAISFLIR